MDPDGHNFLEGLISGIAGAITYAVVFAAVTATIIFAPLAPYIAGMAAGFVSGVISGAIEGYKAGGVGGAFLGAAVGGAVGAVSGLLTAGVSSQTQAFLFMASFAASATQGSESMETFVGGIIGGLVGGFVGQVMMNASQPTQSGCGGLKKYQETSGVRDGGNVPDGEGYLSDEEAAPIFDDAFDKIDMTIAYDQEKHGGPSEFGRYRSHLRSARDEGRIKILRPTSDKVKKMSSLGRNASTSTKGIIEIYNSDSSSLDVTLIHEAYHLDERSRSLFLFWFAPDVVNSSPRWGPAYVLENRYQLMRFEAEGAIRSNNFQWP